MTFSFLLSCRLHFSCIHKFTNCFHPTTPLATKMVICPYLRDPVATPPRFEPVLLTFDLDVGALALDGEGSTEVVKRNKQVQVGLSL